MMEFTNMNWIIYTIWILTPQLLIMKETHATPLMNLAGNKIGENKLQTFSGVRFLDEDYDSSGFDPSADANNCAKGSTFCERIENYPSTEVKSILKEENKYSELFGSDLVNTISVIGNRFGEEEEEEPLCASQTRLVYPQAGLTRDNTWRYIVNQQNYTQGVRVDECVHTKQCYMMHQLPFGFKSQCKQKYVYRQLVALDESGSTIKDLFKIPSCCQCVLIRTHGG